MDARAFHSLSDTVFLAFVSSTSLVKHVSPRPVRCAALAARLAQPRKSTLQAAPQPHRYAYIYYTIAHHDDAAYVLRPCFLHHISWLWNQRFSGSTRMTTTFPRHQLSLTFPPPRALTCSDSLTTLLSRPMCLPTSI